VAAFYAGAFALRPNPVREYQGVGEEEEAGLTR
jgi:hypothetical protein